MSLNSSSGAVGSGRGPGVAQKIWPLLLLENANRLKCQAGRYLPPSQALFLSVYKPGENDKKVGKFTDGAYNNRIIFGKKIMEIL